jgi:hypothetical protein
MRQPRRSTLYPNPGGRLRRGLQALVLGGALAAVTAASAAAHPNTAGAPAAPQAPGATIVRVVAPNPGFDWGDAAIGAASGLAISLVAVGATLTVSRRHADQVST